MLSLASRGNSPLLYSTSIWVMLIEGFDREICSGTARNAVRGDCGLRISDGPRTGFMSPPITLVPEEPVWVSSTQILRDLMYCPDRSETNGT